MINIRLISKKDFPNALRCIRRSIEVSNSPDYPEKVIKYQLNKHYTLDWIRKTTQDRYFVIAELNDQIVGTGALKNNEIRTMFVDPFYQRKGIGQTIINYLEEFAVKNGYSTIFLESSITAVEFYQKIGYFIDKDEIIEWLGVKIRRIVMKKVF